MQGRVITVALNGTAATDPVGLAIAGPLADILGVRIWYVLGGIVTIAMGVGSFFAPAIMHIEEVRTSMLLDEVENGLYLTEQGIGYK